MNLNELIETGHFTKAFDPTRRIPDKTFDMLLKFIYSIPASVNAQSSHYIIAGNTEARERIAGAMGAGFEFNVPKVSNASHVIVFATRQNLTNEYLAELHEKEIADGKFPDSTVADYWKGIVRMWVDLHRYDVKDLQHWMEKQTYLALGMSLMAAAELGIDAAPLEGFNSSTIDAELGLRERGFTTTVLLALGYRGPEVGFLRHNSKIAPIDDATLFISVSSGSEPT